MPYLNGCVVMVMSYVSYIAMALNNGFKLWFIWPCLGKLGFDGHDFSQMLYGKGLVCAFLL